MHSERFWSFPFFDPVVPNKFAPVDFTPWLVVLGVLGFAAASFFFALAESALFTLGKWQVEQLAERAPKEGALVARLLQQPSELLATIVLGNTVANAVIAAVGLGVTVWRDGSVPLAVGGLLGLILIGCEVLPKTLAVRAPEKWSVRVARPMLWVQSVSRPVQRFAQALNNLLLHGIARTVKPQTKATEEDYRELLELAAQQGTLAVREKEIIFEIINLEHKTAADVMTPRSQMASIPDDLSVEEMLAAARKLRHRRLPMYDETPETIVGVLDTKVLLLDPKVDLADAIEFPSFVPESMNLLKLFLALQRQRRGIAMVVNEFGGTAGVVTMEDILEEIVGEIRDEGEEDQLIMEKAGFGKWRLSGAVTVRDFRRECADIGDVPEVETMGGLVTMLLEVVPNAGESVNFRGLKLTAARVDGRSVREVNVERLPKR
ncbi:MAG TPA: hemolysin family protein [Methylomirabilota bacterium]|nr:hemolysin family protein [Methylomirabilota bacterium]